jgi:hypothetical protein
LYILGEFLSEFLYLLAGFLELDQELAACKEEEERWWPTAAAARTGTLP